MVLEPVVSVAAVCGMSTEVEKLPPLSMLIVDPSLYLADLMVSPAIVIDEMVPLAVNPLPDKVILWLGTMESVGVALKLAATIVMLASSSVLPNVTYNFWTPAGTFGTVNDISPIPDADSVPVQAVAAVPTILQEDAD
jgi:hypothetical protein